MNGDEIDRAYSEYVKDRVEQPPTDWRFRARVCEQDGHVPVLVRICRYCCEALGVEEEV